MDRARRLSILGSTGSIGQSTLDVVRVHPDRFEIVALVGNSNLEQLARDAREFRPEVAVTADEDRYGELKQRLSGSGIEAAAGRDAVIAAAGRPADMVMAAIVGASGLAPTLAAIEAGATIALANKECLVSAGGLFMRRAAARGVRIVPVDSEHSAIFQCLEPDNFDAIDRITLTASGGPFRTRSADELASVTCEQALKHPNWAMGSKVTIDSATLMNKGLELIEAYHLFPVGLDRLDVVVHPQSIVHSCVSYVDGSMLAQLGMPDMRTPIACALAWPGRIAAPVERLDLAQIGTLTFEPVDANRFPSLDICRGALARPGSATTIVNAANEVAVAEFLGKRIGFPAITGLVRDVLERAERQSMVAEMIGLDDVWQADAYGRAQANELARALHG